MMNVTGGPLCDAVGTLHTPAVPGSRIVSLVPSITELLCDLGLAAQLVGRTGFCIHPRDKVRSIAKLGGTKTVDVSALRALRPSHVILNMDENERPLALALADFVPHIVVTHPLTPSDNPPLYRLLGGIFGRENEAAELCKRFDAAHAEIEARRASFAPERVLYLIWKDPWMTVAPSTYISATLALVNWNTMPTATHRRYPSIALDEDWLGDVDRVLLSTEPYRFGPAHCAALRKIPAFAGKPVGLIDGEMTSWYGSRAIPGMAYLARLRSEQAPLE